MNAYKFPCGCEFEITNSDIKPNDGLQGIKIDFDNLRLDCPVTWDLLQSGHTKGVFQLETNLGRTWAKKAVPENITEISALVALLRPGVLKAIVDGKSMSQHYCDRKRQIDEIKYFHDALEPIFNDTQGIMLYQEQAMRIAQDIAGFDLQEADVLRKSIGKKDAKLMAQLKSKFIDGCKKKGIVTEEEAEEIFGWIQESQKYSFNKSHSVSYGLIVYWSAYVKAHFPLHFYTSWLYYSHDKMDPQEEMQLLISDARYFDIEIRPPSLQNLPRNDIEHFSLFDDKVYFGLGDIKRIGSNLANKIIENIETVEKKLGRNIKDWTWNDFLIFFSDKVSTVAINGIIMAGATDYMGEDRQKKLHDYNSWKKLTNKEREWIQDNCDYTDLIKSIEELIENKPRLSIRRKEKLHDVIKNLKKPPFDLKDSPHTIATKESELLGVPITYTKLDNCETDLVKNTTCKEFLHGKSGNMTLAVEITNSNEYIIKKGQMKGQKMRFLTVEDETASIDSVVVFPKTVEGNQPILINGATVLLFGKRDKQRTDSFVVEKILPI